MRTICHRFSQNLYFLFALLIFSGVISACGFMSGGLQSTSDRLVRITRLPTLTRTPLPTLTPTPHSALAEITNSTQHNGSATTETRVLADTEITAVEVAQSSNIAPQTATPSFPTATVVTEQSQNSENTTTADTTVMNDFPPTAILPQETAAPVAAEPPTPVVAETVAAINPPTATATETPSPTDTPVPQGPTPMLERDGWSFASMQLFDDQYEYGVLLQGEMINNTGITQELYYVSGTFFNPQGQVIADENSTDDYWPFEIIPPGGRMPFGMFVDGIKSAANFEINVIAEPSDEILDQEFEFLDQNASSRDGNYCVSGRLRNLGEALEYNLVIAAIFYDAQDNMVNFGDFYESSPENITGDQLLDFEICADAFNRQIAHYDLRAWGQ